MTQPLFERMTPTGQPPGAPIGHQGNILHFDRDWQYPAQTERHAFRQLARLGQLPDGVTYIAYPWANLIDKVDTKAADADQHLRDFQAFRQQIPPHTHKLTVCQHIRLREYLHLFEDCGIRDIFWSHATEDDVRQIGSGTINLRPFPLYPVQVPQPDSAPLERRYLFSFIGLVWIPCYLTRARQWIVEHLAEDPRGLVVGREEWHYQKIVYDHQIWGKTTPAQLPELVDAQGSTQFTEALRQSIFSLCPSGSGPNSIRLWESLGAGAIPVILADRYAPPGDRRLWEQAALFCAETPEAIKALPARLQMLADDPARLASYRQAGQQLWARYGTDGFISDVQDLLAQLGEQAAISRSASLHANTAASAATGSAAAAPPLPPAILQQVEAARQRTLAEPLLALNHAVALDQQLQRDGWSTPITYAAQSIAIPGWTGAGRAPQQTGQALHQAEQRQREAGAQQALADAFNQARGAEIPALNLLYANQALDIETLWLRFLNKYLASVTPADASSAAGYQVCLRPGVGTRFQRLQAAQATALAVHSDGPLVSVLMPVHNAARTLRQAAGSILAQSWRRLELLLIDDASSDDSLAIAKALEQQDPRVRVIALGTNGGPYVAKNVALSVARGEYLTVHDADDWAYPSRLADQLLPLLNSADARQRVSLGRALRLQADGRITRFRPLDWITDDGALRLCFPSLLFERRYFDQALGAWDSVRVGADNELLQRLRRFAPASLLSLAQPVMLQLDAADTLTTHADTYCDARGVAPARTAYEQAREAWLSQQTALPRLRFPMTERPFAAPEVMRTHGLGAAALLRSAT